MKRVSFNIILGILLILVGVGYLGNAFGWWNFSVFFAGWWTLFLIIPALYSIIQSGVRMGNFILLGAGVYFFLREQRLITFAITLPMIFSLALILIGVNLIFVNRNSRLHRPISYDTVEKNQTPNYSTSAVFSSKNIALNTHLTTAHLEAVFGNLEVDLSACDLRDTEWIELESVFGSLTLIVNEAVFVSLKEDNVLGNVSYNPNPNALYSLNVNASAVFGNIRILTLIESPEHSRVHPVEEVETVEVHIDL
ncbi:MAG: LiaF transmembrane domain-containing protein [Erysipelotrichaceae bacterium]